jgi:hypothetical protein
VAAAHEQARHQFPAGKRVQASSTGEKEKGNRGVQLTLLAIAPNRLQSW